MKKNVSDKIEVVPYLESSFGFCVGNFSENKKMPVFFDFLSLLRIEEGCVLSSVNLKIIISN